MELRRCILRQPRYDYQANGSQQYDRDSFDKVNPEASGVEFCYFDVKLEPMTTVLATGHEAVCIFVNDQCDSEVLSQLQSLGVVRTLFDIITQLSLTYISLQKYIVLRCAGFNNVDLSTASKLGFKVVNVPAYSPEAVAEFAVGMIMTVVRKYHKAYLRVREGNFLLDGLVGFNLNGKTVGIVGTGKIGLLTGKILSKGFECNVVAYDPYQKNTAAAAEYGVSYVETLEELLGQADIVSLHCPLNDKTKYIINEKTLGQTKKGVILVNTSRGALIDTGALIQFVSTFRDISTAY